MNDNTTAQTEATAKREAEEPRSHILAEIVETVERATRAASPESRPRAPKLAPRRVTFVAD